MRYLIVSLTVMSFLWGCKKEIPPVSQPAAAEAAVLQEIGAQAAAMLMDSLKKELKSAMMAGGPVKAIDVCSQKALALTHSITKVEDKTVQLKRTSLKTRNPANMPDTYEALALKYFAENTDTSGALPENYMQKIHEANADFYYYYQPLKVGEMCLKCHGPAEQLSAQVKQLLSERYPADKATGYTAGMLRGLIRVRVDAL